MKHKFLVLSNWEYVKGRFAWTLAKSLFYTHMISESQIVVFYFSNTAASRFPLKLTPSKYFSGQRDVFKSGSA